MRDKDTASEPLLSSVRLDADDTKTDTGDGKTCRFDRNGALKGQGGLTNDGYLRLDAVVTRCGVFKYKNNDGSFRYELRHPDEVFNEDSLKTLSMIPVTNEHPSVKLLNPTNVKKYQVGFTGENIRRDEDDLMSSLTVSDSTAISDVYKGKRELSCGYKQKLIREDGVYNGEKYTHRQTEIEYNHVALVPVGRAGTSRINLDSGDAESFDDEKEINQNSLNSITLQKEKKMEEELKKRLEAEAALKVAQVNLDAANVELSKTKANLDSVQVRLDAMEKRDIASEIQAGIKARRALENAAAPHLDKNVNLDGMSDDELKKAVVLKAMPTLSEKVVNCDSAYLSTSFDNAVAFLSSQKAAGDAGKQRQAVAGVRNDANDNSGKSKVDVAREAYVKRLLSGGDAK